MVLSPDRQQLLADAVADNDLSAFQKLFDESSADTDMEAVLAAAVLAQRRSIVQFLVRQRQQRLSLPHPDVCDCPACEQRRADPFLMRAYVTGPLSALVSPLYLLSLDDAGADPLDLCFRIAKSLKVVAPRAREKLLDSLEDAVCILLDACHSETEAQALMLGEGRAGKGACGKADQLGSVYRLMDSPLSDTVAHPTCQLIMERVWTEGLASWKDRGHGRSVRLFLLACMSLVLTPVVIVLPVPRLTRIFDSPGVGYLVDGLSHIIHLKLTLIFIVVSHANILDLFRDKMCNTRRMLALYYFSAAGFLFSINVGRLIGNVHLLWRNARRWWAAFDLYEGLCLVATVTQCAALTTIFTWYVRLEGIIHIMMPNTTHRGHRHQCACDIAGNLIRQRGCTRDFGMDQVYCTGDMKGRIFTFDDLSLIEPYITAAMLQSITVMCLTLFICKLMYMFESVGFIVVSLEKVMRDVMRFCYILVVVMIAWTAGLNCTYSLFPCENEVFSRIPSTMSTLTWAIFGMSDTGSPDLKNMHGSTVLKLVGNFGFVLYVSFVMVSTVILINILIAMMSSTYERSENRKDYLWLRKKTELQLKYICAGTCFPPPFNLLTPLYYLLVFIRDWVIRLFTKVREKTAEEEMQEEEMKKEAIMRVCRRAQNEVVCRYPD